ncbi:MAG: (d)CMP kinase [Ruminococcaceae bacterium]|nr:(d)CMP kinase [Oscillospiraceae bacterium]
MINIAIDGPAGAGKSTVARAIAKDYGYIYVDTGALYRALAYKAINNGIDVKDEINVTRMLGSTKLDITYTEKGQRIILDGEDISDSIRTAQISMGASDISALPFVREWLLDMQKDIARKNDCIMDGRDIGTTILPDAEIKIFLTASVEERANRRYKELVAKGESITLEAVIEDVKTRDYNDSHRAVSPLKKADDAIEVDTTNLDFGQTVNTIKEIIDTHIGGEK